MDTVNIDESLDFTVKIYLFLKKKCLEITKKSVWD